MHRYHHSVDPDHYDSNYGYVLSVWDRILGSLRLPGGYLDITVGLADGESLDYRGVGRLCVVPFQKAWKVVHQRGPVGAFLPN